MKSILALGVTRINDSYPNVKYKLTALARIFGDRCIDAVIPIDSGPEFAAIMPNGKSGKLGLAWKMSLGHLKAFYRSATQRADIVYVCYPGIVLAAWLGLPFVRSRYKAIYLDAFISLYDTIVCDRRLLRPGRLAAKFLFTLERRALAAATTVIVDTPENADHYSSLFNVPLTRFQVMPLSIPPLSPAGSAWDETTGSRLRCVFVGTFVPLQGVPVIVEAMGMLADETDIEFVFVGDGQDASYLEEHIESCPAENMTWHRGHFPTDFVVEQIESADVCLGVFGEGEKTQRVLPYKLYYYLALAMPVVTASSATTLRIFADCAHSGDVAPLAVVPAGDARSLANMLLRFRDNRSEFAGLGKAGRQFYQRALSDSVIERQLEEIFELASPAMTKPDNKLDPRSVPVPNDSNTAAVIVSYFPENQFEQRLKDLGEQFAAVFWVDNTPQQDNEGQQIFGGKVHYLSKGENAGLAGALNWACREALDAGFSWVVTFDQDSLVAADFLTRQIEGWRQSTKPAFILGCNYTDSADKESPRFRSGSNVRECRTVITSGSLMCLPVWRELGEFRGDYFIDGVDHEICLRARANDLLIARHGQVLMQHQIGEKSLGLNFLPYLQPAVRMYYGSRNGVRNIIEFASSEPIWAARKVMAIGWESLIAVLLGPDRISKFRAIVGGLVDGVRGTMGPARKDYFGR